MTFSVREGAGSALGYGLIAAVSAAAAKKATAAPVTEKAASVAPAVLAAVTIAPTESSNAPFTTTATVVNPDLVIPAEKAATVAPPVLATPAPATSSSSSTPVKTVTSRGEWFTVPHEPAYRIHIASSGHASSYILWHTDGKPKTDMQDRSWNYLNLNRSAPISDEIFLRNRHAYVEYNQPDRWTHASRMDLGGWSFGEIRKMVREA